MRVLSSAQVSHFIETGFVRLEGAFSQATATRVCRDLESRLKLSFADATTWPRCRVTLAEVMTMAPYTDAISQRFNEALDDLIGRRSWQPVTYMGWWQITFPGFADVDYGNDWHVDGKDFVHRPWSEDLRMFPLFLFTDIAPGEGGTLLDVGSHRRVAEVLWQHEPEGLSCNELSRIVTELPSARSEVVEAVGSAGDVILCHPMIFHSSNCNEGSTPRVQATPHIMGSSLSSRDRGRSPVNVAIHEAGSAARGGAHR